MLIDQITSVFVRKINGIINEHMFEIAIVRSWYRFFTFTC